MWFIPALINKLSSFSDLVSDTLIFLLWAAFKQNSRACDYDTGSRGNKMFAVQAVLSWDSSLRLTFTIYLASERITESRECKSILKSWGRWEYQHFFSDVLENRKKKKKLKTTTVMIYLTCHPPINVLPSENVSHTSRLVNSELSEKLLIPQEGVAHMDSSREHVKHSKHNPIWQCHYQNKCLISIHSFLH